MFKFGFSHEDSPELAPAVGPEDSLASANGSVISGSNINNDINANNDGHHTDANTNTNDPEFIPVPRKLADLISEPLRVSYEFIQVADHTIPKRDLYDVKYQLMRKSSLSSTEEILLNNNEDIRKATYEGGIKIWECSADLTNYISVNQQSLRLHELSVLEMGCGAALPSCYALQTMLKQEPTTYKRRLVLSDYNVNVLQLVTAPNIFLSWILVTNPNVALYGQELDITPERMTEFEKDLEKRNIEVTFVPGSWGPDFARVCGEHQFDLVLASETVYSPEIVPVFTDSMLQCLKEEHSNENNNKTHKGIGLVAAKKIYFGVGGGIPEFTHQLDIRSVPWETVSDHKDGIGRAIIRI